MSERAAQASFRLASDRDYRRGVILGLTLAEVLLLLVFLLLLAAGALVARTQEDAARQAARVSELQSQLQPVIDALNQSGHAVSDIDSLSALIRRGREADMLRDQLKEARSALEVAEKNRQSLDEERKQLKAALDDRSRQADLLQSQLEEARAAIEAGRQSLDQARNELKDFDRMVAALKALPGGVGEHPDQDLMNRLGQYRQAMEELARLKGNGSGLPYCWVTPSGQPIYMLRFELHDDGFMALEQQPRPRPEDPVWALLANLPRNTLIPENDLATQTASLIADASRRQCRYAVDVVDRTRATNKQGYKHLNYLLDHVFARHEISG